tara:strand:+ start:394 stop:891 length:498 start_codon:yes stop_codon:yes gene_type:complete
MMGSGKTSTGPVLAKSLDYAFVDSDKIIEDLVKMSISDFFEVEGEESFRILESQVLKSIGERHSLIVATGGGSILNSENWGVLHQGIVIWLDASKELLLERLKLDNQRPLLKNDIESNLNKLLKERKPIYSEADLHIVINKQESLDEIAKKVLNGLLTIISSPEV